MIKRIWAIVALLLLIVAGKVTTLYVPDIPLLPYIFTILGIVILVEIVAREIESYMAIKNEMFKQIQKELVNEIIIAKLEDSIEKSNLLNGTVESSAKETQRLFKQEMDNKHNQINELLERLQVLDYLPHLETIIAHNKEITEFNKTFFNEYSKNTDQLFAMVKEYTKQNELISGQLEVIKETIDAGNNQQKEENTKIKDALIQNIQNTNLTTNEKIQELVNSIEQNQARLADSIKESLNDTNNEINHIGDKLVTVKESIDDGNTQQKEEISKIIQMPNMVYEMQDEFIQSMQNTNLATNEKIQELVDSIEEKQNRLTRSIRDSFDDLMDEIEEVEISNKEEIKQLADQYHKFEDYNKTVVQQMTKMSNDDYQLLSRFLNDKRHK